jgi:hypothetical protein
MGSKTILSLFQNKLNSVNGVKAAHVVEREALEISAKIAN